MARPRKRRRICCRPGCELFKPSGKCLRGVPPVVLLLDEFEALRLSDMEGLQHEAAAARLDVSRPSFTRILNEARRKVATALTLGQPLMINGGDVELAKECIYRCRQCGAANEVEFGGGRPESCAACGGEKNQLYREDV